MKQLASTQCSADKKVRALGQVEIAAAPLPGLWRDPRDVHGRILSRWALEGLEVAIQSLPKADAAA
jgi:hypothetical protein